MNNNENQSSYLNSEYRINDEQKNSDLYLRQYNSKLIVNSEMAKQDQNRSCELCLFSNNNNVYQQNQMQIMKDKRVLLNMTMNDRMISQDDDQEGERDKRRERDKMTELMELRKRVET